MYITLSQAKQHLNIEPDFHDDDQYIISLIDAAENAVRMAIDRPLEDTLEDGELPGGIRHAILLLTGTYYANRETVAYGAVNKIPHTFDMLISQQKIYGPV